MNRHRSLVTLALAATGSAVVLVASCAGPSPTPARALTPTALPTATPRPVRTVEQVTQALPTSEFLDARHAARKVVCAACHAQTPQAAPAKEVCLGCHGGSYTALGDKTAGGKFNPHRSHNGDLACTECHRMHEPFHLYCQDCHEGFRSDRYH